MTHTDRLNRFAQMSDQDFAEMATPRRNEILDELRRREETMEARAEERRHGGFFVPWYLQGGAR